MFLSSILWLLIFTNFVNAYFIDNNTNHNLKFCKNIVESFLQGQDSVTVFKDDKSKDFYRSEIIKAIQTIVPVLVYDGINEDLADKIHDMGDELNVPSMTKSYLALSESSEWINLNLNLFSKVNTNGKWIFFLVNFEEDKAEILLENGFKKHKMMNILLFFIDRRANIFVASFNPFDRLNKFWLMKVKFKNLPEILDKVKKVFEKKVENLNGFELKVSTFYEASKTSDILNEPIPELFKKALNCNFKFSETSDGIYGSQLPNGSFTG